MMHFLNLGFTWNEFCYQLCGRDVVLLFSVWPVSCPRVTSPSSPSDFSHFCHAQNERYFLGLFLICPFESIGLLVFPCQ